MDARGIDGLVISTPQNVYYLSGFNATAPKADEPPGVAVVISRHDLQHPILIAPDIFLSPFLDAPIWIDDLRPHRSVLLPVGGTAQPSAFNKFMPASQQDAAWVKGARDNYVGSFAEACRNAIQDLGLGAGRVGYDDLRLGAKLAGSMSDVVDAYNLMMFVREVKNSQEIQWLRESTLVNQAAIERTVQAWSRGTSWKELVATYHSEITALGGWISDPGGVFFANPLDGDPAVRLRVESEDFVVQPGTSIMFDCHGTKNLYCWDGGKTWVVEDEPSGISGRIARATAEAMGEIHQAMRPGVRVSELQDKSQQTFQRLEVPQYESVLTYFHGLGLSHTDVLALADDDADPNWALQEGMVIAAHLLCPGDEKQRCWIEEVFWVKEGGAEPFFTWGNNPLTNG
jgi:Xaa-Pro aminopeptidase